MSCSQYFPWPSWLCWLLTNNATKWKIKFRVWTRIWTWCHTRRSSRRSFSLRMAMTLRGYECWLPQNLLRWEDRRWWKACQSLDLEINRHMLKLLHAHLISWINVSWRDNFLMWIFKSGYHSDLSYMWILNCFVHLEFCQHQEYFNIAFINKWIKWGLHWLQPIRSYFLLPVASSYLSIRF